MVADQTTVLQRCLDRLNAGDDTARNELITRAQRRLQRLTRTMLRDYGRLKSWEETDDVFQGALVRLCQALRDVNPPTVRSFFRLAALQIRRELIDLARHYYGPEGPAANLAQAPDDPREGDSSDFQEESNLSCEPGRLAVWTEFHRSVEKLPEEEQEIFDLLWYQELTQTEAATLLGVDVRTVKRRWQSARLMLHDALKGEWPGPK